jgi:hypothetical protein
MQCGKAVQQYKNHHCRRNKASFREVADQGKIQGKIAATTTLSATLRLLP